MSNKYRVAIITDSSKSLLELVRENLDKAKYAHNKTRTRVVSIPAEFIKLLSSLYKESGHKTMHELFIAMAVGNYHIESKLWRKFVNGVCNVVNFSDMPTESDCVELYELICENFEESNPHVTTELRAIQETIYTERTTPKGEDTPEVNDEVVPEAADETETKVNTVSA